MKRALLIPVAIAIAQKVERDAMEKLFADFPAFWRGIVDTRCR